jgi:hypothetical protein
LKSQRTKAKAGSKLDSRIEELYKPLPQKDFHFCEDKVEWDKDQSS